VLYDVSKRRHSFWDSSYTGER